MTRIASAAVSHFIILIASFISGVHSNGTANAGPISTARAGGPIYALVVDPAAVNIDAPTFVRVSVTITTNQELSSIVLELLNAKSDPQIIGEMKDDGLNGDIRAGDRIYSTSFQLLEKKVGFVNLRASAKIGGLTEKSPVTEMAVLPTGAPVGINASSGLNNIARDPKTGTRFVADDVNVCFGRTVAYEKVLAVAKSVEGKVVGRFSELGNCYQFKVPSSKDGSTVLGAIKKIKGLRGVLTAEPNHVFQMK